MDVTYRDLEGLVSNIRPTAALLSQFVYTETTHIAAVRAILTLLVTSEPQLDECRTFAPPDICPLRRPLPRKIQSRTSAPVPKHNPKLQPLALALISQSQPLTVTDGAHVRDSSFRREQVSGGRCPGGQLSGHTNRHSWSASSSVRHHSTGYQARAVGARVPRTPRSQHMNSTQLQSASWSL